MEEELEKMMTKLAASFFFLHNTHTRSMNVVDVYIQNRLNDVCTSESLKKALLIVIKMLKLAVAVSTSSAVSRGCYEE